MSNKQPKEPSTWKSVVTFIVVAWLYGLIIAVMAGLVAANHIDSACSYTYRIDYILPSRKVGCWLGEKVD